MLHVVQRTSTFPRQEELYDCYRLVYLEPDQRVTAEQLAGAAAFKAMKDFIEQYKQTHQGPVVADEQTRPALLELVKREVVYLEKGLISADTDTLRNRLYRH